MKMLLPLILLLVGIGGGVGAGLALRPAPASHADEMATPDAPDGAEAAASDAADDTHGSKEHADDSHGEDDHEASAGSEYIKLNNQFVVPIVTRDSIEAVIVMSLSLEVPSGRSEAVYLHEPKLRDAFLQVMFDHANMGGFAGIFTDTAKLNLLRSALYEVATTVLGDGVNSILITDFVRQQM
ncbi:Flagellar basal body-associated protein FliL [Roseovarius nanhaiticus]|uniref:Flagellar protein FliL n=2 Tax=Roseovarius nanhaiticus TaxID=573024 RepID=A0A1N7HL92_9RHOB|nr:flagellar basal body-associated FliL family protein [Roseovarius nanhaiticus]SEL26868.1 Flagellar basal body-associated protein FliL [Roseovarius nanhaiticus]SIS25521.1 Flagellar basal body-associated protein FliL [Roseovarius nanhaiticus]